MVDDDQCFEEGSQKTPVPPPSSRPAPGSRSPQQLEEIQRGVESLGIVEGDLS